MLPALRGFVEKTLDSLLEPENLEMLSQWYEHFRPFVKSKEDAMFGDIVGTVQERYCHIASGRGIYPSKEEMTEVLSIIDRRVHEIKSKILMVTSR